MKFVLDVPPVLDVIPDGVATKPCPSTTTEASFVRALKGGNAGFGYDFAAKILEPFK